MQKSWLVAFTLVAACGGPDDALESCKVVCTDDADCPTGQTCGELGRCTSGPACPCTADEFLGCVDSDANALYCSPTGDGLRTETCAGGCNTDASRCNACVPDAVACLPDRSAIETCANDGSATTSASCTLDCLDADATHPVRCGYIEPVFLPDVCDEPATAPSFDPGATGTLDTGLDLLCNGGIITQTAGPAICVVRYKTIEIAAARSFRVTGARALALVADDTLTIAGVLDASAGGAGAGGTSGGQAFANSGGGGAGFRVAGASGGASDIGNGGAGGAMLTPDAAITGLIGGRNPTRPSQAQQTLGHPLPGAGGGALALVACRGTVTVSGTIDVNGGGGGGGRAIQSGGNTVLIGGTGGGSGGFVVMAGIDVVVTGNLFANGGGGGGGCTLANCTNPGQVGQRSTAVAQGGIGGTDSGSGGNGGTGATAPTPGIGAPSLPGKGGGGGAAGWLWAYTPAGFAPTITPAMASPSIEAKNTPTSTP